MAKNGISEIQPILGFMEFDILKKYRKSFENNELCRIHSFFLFSSIAKDMKFKDSILD